MKYSRGFGLLLEILIVAAIIGLLVFGSLRWKNNEPVNSNVIGGSSEVRQGTTAIQEARSVKNLLEKESAAQRNDINEARP